MAQDEFLQRHPQSVFQDARAQPTDGPAGDFNDPGFAVMDPQFGVDRPLRESHGRGSPLDGVGRGLLRFRGQARRRHVNRLLEIGSFQRIGLVEQREHVQAAAAQQALQGHLHAWNVGLHHDAAGVGVQARRPVLRAG